MYCCFHRRGIHSFSPVIPLGSVHSLHVKWNKWEVVCCYFPRFLFLHFDYDVGLQTNKFAFVDRSKPFVIFRIFNNVIIFLLSDCPSFDGIHRKTASNDRLRSIKPKNVRTFQRNQEKKLRVWFVMVNKWAFHTSSSCFERKWIQKKNSVKWLSYRKTKSMS